MVIHFLEGRLAAGFAQRGAETAEHIVGNQRAGVRAQIGKIAGDELKVFLRLHGGHGAADELDRGVGVVGQQLFEQRAADQSGGACD